MIYVRMYEVTHSRAPKHRCLVVFYDPCFNPSASRHWQWHRSRPTCISTSGL